MTKFAISLIALAALSTASFAGENRSYDLRDSATYYGKYATQLENSATSANAVVIAAEGNPTSNFERLNKVSQENLEGGH